MGRCMALTEDGLICLVPADIEDGDELYVLSGGQMIPALRKDGDGHTLVWECYLHGIMDGELSKILAEGLLVPRVLRIK